MSLQILIEVVFLPGKGSVASFALVDLYRRGLGVACEKGRGKQRPKKATVTTPRAQIRGFFSKQFRDHSSTVERIPRGCT